MKISVIVPVYNAAAYLGACLDSVVAATARFRGGEVELICVDDGSVDASGRMLDAFATRFRETAAEDAGGHLSVSVLHQANAGVSAARNAGLALATGELVAFLDSDDTFDPRAFAIFSEVWRGTGAEVMRYGCNQVDDHARDVMLVGEPPISEIDVEGSSVSPLRSCGLGAATVVSARLAKTVTWPDLTQCEDPLFVLRCLRVSAKSVSIGGNLVNYLVRGNSASHAVSLKIVTATCRYLPLAYDACAALPGFRRSRADTCAFLSGFLNGPLSTCGGDVPPHDRVAAEASVAEARAALRARDALFAVRTGNERFDVAFSLGSACSCTETLRDAGLQFASFPFDWLLGPGPVERTKLLVDGFTGWMDDVDAFEEIPNPDAFRHAPCRNRQTRYSYLHDFEQGVPLTDQLPAVREKYHRRIERLLNLISRAKRVLVVWTGDPRDQEKISAEDVTTCLGELGARFPGVSFKMQVFECAKGVPESDPEVLVGQDFVRISFDYRLPGSDSEWAIRREALLPYLAGYSVADYRTPALRRAHNRAERLRDRERFPAKTFLGYLLLKFEFKLYKHLQKVLKRRRVTLE